MAYTLPFVRNKCVTALEQFRAVYPGKTHSLHYRLIRFEGKWLMNIALNADGKRCRVVISLIL